MPDKDFSVILINGIRLLIFASPEGVKIKPFDEMKFFPSFQSDRSIAPSAATAEERNAALHTMKRLHHALNIAPIWEIADASADITNLEITLSPSRGNNAIRQSFLNVYKHVIKFKHAEEVNSVPDPLEPLEISICEAFYEALMAKNFMEDTLNYDLDLKRYALEGLRESTLKRFRGLLEGELTKSAMDQAFSEFKEEACQVFSEIKSAFPSQSFAKIAESVEDTLLRKVMKSVLQYNNQSRNAGV